MPRKKEREITLKVMDLVPPGIKTVFPANTKIGNVYPGGEDKVCPSTINSKLPCCYSCFCFPKYSCCFSFYSSNPALGHYSSWYSRSAPPGSPTCTPTPTSPSAPPAPPAQPVLWSTASWWRPRPHWRASG